MEFTVRHIYHRRLPLTNVRATSPRLDDDVGNVCGEVNVAQPFVAWKGMTCTHTVLRAEFDDGNVLDFACTDRCLDLLDLLEK
ncbi:hypothetical protein PG993_004687 [Apiospora rasikravindrae]|uniref:Uncharacterized protein n=1 Tax=Apiospora rasikravindrae TaxID=990691 RepID=A0ABR1TDJ9_9PEZI